MTKSNEGTEVKRVVLGDVSASARQGSVEGWGNEQLRERTKVSALFFRSISTGRKNVQKCKKCKLLPPNQNEGKYGGGIKSNLSLYPMTERNKYRGMNSFALVESRKGEKKFKMGQFYSFI